MSTHGPSRRRASDAALACDTQKRQEQSRRNPYSRTPCQYVGTREAAEFLGVSESYLNKARHFGNGPPFCRFGRTIRYDVQALEAWAQDRTVNPSDASGDAGGSA